MNSWHVKRHAFYSSRTGKLFLSLASLLGSTSITFAQPANNNFADAIEVNAPYVTGSNVGATRQAGEPQTVKHGSVRSPLGGRSVWWKWTAPETRRYTVKTGDRSGREPSSDFDTQVAVYTGTALSNLREVASSEDNPDYDHGLSSVEIQATQGQTYYILVDGFQGKTGTIYLYVIPPRYSLTVTVDPPESGHVSFSPVFDSGGYEDGTVVTLEAYPTTSTNFYAWSGSDGGRSSTISVVMDRHKTIVAHFATPPTSTQRDQQLLWRHINNGRIAAWNFVDGSFSESTSLTNLGKAWRLAGTLDVDGNSYNDLLYQHANGRILAALLSDTNLLENRIVTQTPGWRLVGTGDFDYDAQRDLLQQNGRGALRVLIMKDGQLSQTVSAGVSAPGWRIAAVTDLNNDAATDIVFQHTNGKLSAWLMNGVQKKSAINLEKTGWRLCTAADLDRNGTPELVFQNPNGRSAAWFLDGTNVISKPFLRDGYAMPKAWKLNTTR